MKVLVDMNLSPRLVALLSEAGFEAVHWSQVGQPTAPDVEIMAYAKIHDLVVPTHDLDFSAILAATNADKPSVVQIRAVDLTPETLVGPVIIGLRHGKSRLHQPKRRSGRRCARLVGPSPWYAVICCSPPGWQTDDYGPILPAWNTFTDAHPFWAP